VHAYAVHPGMIATDLGRYLTADDVAELGCMYDDALWTRDAHRAQQLWTLSEQLTA
jgi:hypothetical protein